MEDLTPEPTAYDRLTGPANEDAVFFDYNHVDSILERAPTVDGQFVKLAELSENLKALYSNSTWLQDKHASGSLPGWSLAFYDYPTVDHASFIVPVYNHVEQRFEAALICRDYPDARKYIWVDRDFTAELKRDSTTYSANYWHAVFEHFDDPTTNSIEGVLEDRTVLPCVISQQTDWCHCADGSTMLGVCYANQCDAACTSEPNNGGNSGGSGNELFPVQIWVNFNHGAGSSNPCPNPPPSDDEYLHVVSVTEIPNIYTGTSGPCGTGDLVYVSWAEFGNAFSICGSSLTNNFPPPPSGNGPNGDGGGQANDGFGSLTIVMNSGSLLELQIRAFLGRYNLNYTPEEILSLVGGFCEELTDYHDVENLIKWSLINDLADEYYLSDECKWALFDDFELFSNNTSSIQTTLLECNFEVDVVNHTSVDGILVGLDDRGVTHVNIPPIDFSTASDQEIGDQLGSVFYAVSKAFCESSEYEAIDLEDYFLNFSLPMLGGSANNIQFSVDGCGVINLNWSSSLSDGYVVDIGPCKNNDLGQSWGLTFCFAGTSNFFMQFNIPYECLDQFEAIFTPDC